MFYAPFRRTRSAAIVYLGIVASLVICAVVIVFISNGGRFKVVHPVASTSAHVVSGTTSTLVITDEPTVPHAKPAAGGTSTHVHGTVEGDQDLYAIIVEGLAYGLAFLATAMGLTFAAENDGHLEFAWTRPITRERYALGILAGDVAGMLVAYVISIAIVVLGVLACGGIEFFTKSHVAAKDFVPVLLALGFPFLMYAWIAALSASLRRGRAFAVLLWPAMMVLAIAASTVAKDSPFKPVLVAVNQFVNPLEIFGQDSHHDLTLSWTLYGLAFAAVLIGLTIGQWRRLEA